MKKKFYNKLFNELNLNGDAFVVSIIKGTYNEEIIIGKSY
jgi:hypothetical protein